jgi:hypothetical protein
MNQAFVFNLSSVQTQTNGQGERIFVAQYMEQSGTMYLTRQHSSLSQVKEQITLRENE